MRLTRLHTAQFFYAFLSLMCAVFCLVQPAAARAQYGTLSGTVTGTTVFTQVTATDENNPMNQYSGNVNIKTGAYTIYNVPVGVYQITVSQPSSGYTFTGGPYVNIEVLSGDQLTGFNFVGTPIPVEYTVSGTVTLPASACPQPNSVGQPPPITYVSVQIAAGGSTYTATAAVQNGQGTYQYTVPAVPTLVTPVNTANYAGTAVQPTVVGVLNYTANLSLQRLTFDICGNLIGKPAANGPSFAVGLSTAVAFNAQITGVQADGTYAFRNVAPGFYYLNMGQTYPGYSVSPAYPAQLNALVLVNDSTQNNFTVTPLVGAVTGSFTGLPPNITQGVSLCIFTGSVSAAKCIDSKTVTGNAPIFTFTNVQPGTYIVRVAAPNGQFNITPTNSVALNVTAFNVTQAGVFSVSNGGNNVLQGNITFSGNPTNLGTVYVTLTSTTYPGFSMTTQVTLSGIFIQDNIPQKFQFGGPGVNIPPGNYQINLTSGTLGITPSSTSFNLPQAASGTMTWNVGTFQTTEKGVNVNYAPATGPQDEVKFRTDLVGKVSLPSLINPEQPGAVKLGPTPKPNLFSKLSLIRPSNTLAPISRLAPSSTLEPSSTPTPMVGGGLVTPSTSSGTVVDTIHFVNGFGPPDPNNPGYNLPDPNAPSAGLALYVGAIYAPLDGWYLFRSISNGPLALAVNGFPGQVPLVIDAPSDTYQAQYGSTYLQGGHQYYLAVYYYYDDVNTVALDLSWQPVGANTYTTISDPYLSQGATQEPLQSWYNPLDNFTAAAYPNQVAAANDHYIYVRNEGCAYPYQLPGTVPLYRLWNGVDNFDTATADGLNWAATRTPAYGLAGVDSYIFPTQLGDGTSVPFYTFFNPYNNDNYETGSAAGIAAAEASGYILARTEGYVLPAADCQ